MVIINGHKFYEKPGSCGTCEFFYSGSTSMQANGGKGHCLLFDEWHSSYINLPARCQTLFNKAFRFPDGMRLSIVAKTE